MERGGRADVFERVEEIVEGNGRARDTALYLHVG